MLTSLDFVAPGKPWPPEDPHEKARLAEHARNRAIYNDLHEEVFEKYRTYLQDKQDDDKKIVIILGWAEGATTSYLNLLVGEEPDVKAPKIYSRPDEEVFIDASRYGIGLYEISQDGIFAQNPENCYLVVTPGNIRKVQAYVFFHKFEQQTLEKKIEYVKITIHLPGTIQHLVYELKDGKLGGRQPLASFPQFASLQVDEDGRQSTGIKEMLIIRVDNKLTSERYFGQSDYTPAACSQIEALELAFARRHEVLAKFSRPLFMAPESAFNHFNHAKQVWEIRLDKPLMVEPGSMEAKFLTWQAELGAVEREIEQTMDQLLIELKLSKVMLAGKDAGQADSGTALRIRLIPTLSKVRKFASALKRAIPDVESLKSKLDAALKVPDSKPFEPSQVHVQIKDGIPDDPTERNNWISVAYGGGFMSLETAVATSQGLDLESQALKDELARIRGAQPAAPAAPAIELPSLGQGG